MRASVAWIVGVLLCLGACTEAEKPLALPETVAGGWRRTSVQPVAAGQGPGRVGTMGFKSGLAGKYEGPAMIEVEVFEMNSATEAFSAQQSWRPDGQRMISRKNQYFLTARSPHPDRNMLGDFLTALEKQL